MAANMAAFGHISDTEDTFLEIPAVIVKTYYVNLLLVLHRYPPDNISHYITRNLDY